MRPVDERGRLESDPFTWRASKSGLVFISRGGKIVTTIRGKAADQFLDKISALDDDGSQLLMAKQTGHYKHGNER